IRRSLVAGVPPPTVASVSSDRMCSSRSYPIRGNDWISLATTVGSSPAASSFAQARLSPRNAKIVNTSRPRGWRCARAPPITRSRISQPSTHPLSAAAVASRRARPDGVGICGGFVHTRSNRSSPTGAQQSPRRVSRTTPLRAASSGGRACTVAPRTRWTSAASAAGTVETAAVRLTSAIRGLPYSPRLVAGGRGGAQVIQARLEPARAHTDADRLGEVQRRVRLLPRGDLVTEPAERRERLLADPGIDEELVPFVVQARRLDG